MPADTSGLRVLLPERSSAILTDVVARLDQECGTSPCLDLTLRARSDGLFPPAGHRRMFRIFLGRVSELTEESYIRTFVLLTTDEDPGLSVAGPEATVRFDDVRGLRDSELDLIAAQQLGILVFGATENAEVSYLSPDGIPVFPDLSLFGAATTVER